MDEITLDQLIEMIKGSDANARAEAWQAAGPLGAAAVKPLMSLFVETDAELNRLTSDPKPNAKKRQKITHVLEVSRAGKRAVWLIVRHAGRPGNDDARKAVEAELCGLLGEDQAVVTRREVLWMLSEIGGDYAVDAIREIPDILQNKDLRDDARCTVQRIPTDYALQTLTDGLEAAPDDYQPAMAQSLRVRGVDVPGIPCEKLTPTKQTNVKPVGR